MWRASSDTAAAVEEDLSGVSYPRVSISSAPGLETTNLLTSVGTPRRASYDTGAAVEEDLNWTTEVSLPQREHLKMSSGWESGRTRAGGVAGRRRSRPLVLRQPPIRIPAPWRVDFALQCAENPGCLLVEGGLGLGDDVGLLAAEGAVEGVVGWDSGLSRGSGSGLVR